MEDCNYCLVDEKVRERQIGSMRERERGGEGDGFRRLGLCERSGEGEKIIKNCKRMIFY